MVTVEKYYLSSGDVVTINLNNANKICSNDGGATYSSKDEKSCLLVNLNSVVMKEAFNAPEEDHNYNWEINGMERR